MFFKVGDEISWTLTKSFTDALEIAYIYKAFKLPVTIYDAVKNEVIYKG